MAEIHSYTAHSLPFIMSTKSFYSLQSISNQSEDIHCQLLEIDSYKILLNMGSDQELNVLYADELESILETIDCILISHAELKYIGGILRFYKNYKGKIIATLPVRSFGKLMFNEIIQHMNIQGRSKYTFTDIEECFDKIIEVKYSQPIDIGLLRIIAQNSGHSLGGALWQIQKENEIVTVALGINHKKEDHIDGCDFSNLKKSFLFLTNCNFVGEKPISRKTRDTEIHNFIEENQHNKIIFICSLMRSLELCCVVNSFIESKENLKCSFLSYQGHNIHETIKSLLEWTGDLALKKFTSQKVNPFKFENIKFCSLYNKIEDNTNIFIVLDENRNSVFTQKLLYDLNNEQNAIALFTDKDENDLINIQELDVPNFISPEEQIISEAKKSMEERVKDPKIDQIGSAAHVIRYTKPVDFLQKNIFVFPFRNKQKPKDFYGEYIEKSVIIPNKDEKSEIQELDDKKNDIEQFETVRFKRKFFKCKFKTHVFNFSGLIDGNSMKDIVESINIEKLILFGSERVFVDFFHDLCLLTKSVNEIVILRDQKVNLSIDTSISKVDLSEKFLEEAKPKEYKNKLMSPFVGKINQNVLYYKRPCTKSFSFGSLDINTLTKQFLDRNLRVRKTGTQSLLVEDSVEIEFDHSEVWIRGDLNNKLLAVRDVIYSNLIFID